MNGEIMWSQDFHLSDQELLLAADDDLSPARAAHSAAHLPACWSCRTRKREIEAAILGFIRLYRGGPDPLLPPAAGPRARLKVQFAEKASVPQPWSNRWPPISAWKRFAAAILFAIAAIVGGIRTLL